MMVICQPGPEFSAMSTPATLPCNPSRALVTGCASRSEDFTEATEPVTSALRIVPYPITTTESVACRAMVNTTTPASADPLPLQRGYYVQSDTPCQSASNATITRYDGSSFGAAHTECRKPAFRKLSDGNYESAQRCRGRQGRGCRHSWPRNDCPASGW